MNTKFTIFTIRETELGDDEAIRLARMKFILEVYFKDYTKEEINGWGKRLLVEISTKLTRRAKDEIYFCTNLG